MNKIRYDPRNPDPTVIRQAVFARLRVGWGQVERSDYDGRTLRQGFDQVVEFVEPSQPIPKWERSFMEAVTRWPPSAAQTVQTVFPYTAFTKTHASEV